jgi:hypothetical protein
MSFANFVEKKISYKPPGLSLDNYKEKLSEHVFSLQKTGGLSRHFLNLPRIERLLHEINYPDKERFLISITSGNVGKVRKLSLEFNEWSKQRTSKSINELQNCLVRLKSFLYFDKELGIDDAKAIIESKLRETEFESKAILQNIDSIIRLSDWGHMDIVVEPIFEDSGDLVADEFKVCVGDNYFVYAKTTTGHEIKDLQINESQIIESQKLLWLQNKMSKGVFKEFVKLYFIQPKKKRAIFEQMKKDLALGRPVSFPTHIILYENKPEVDEKEDVWKVKMERKYLVENSNNYEVLGDEVPFRWLEMAGNDEK